MAAVVMFAPAAPILSSLSLYATFALLLVVGIVFAPQPIKRDRRVVAFVLVLFVVGIVGHRTDAVYTTICNSLWWAFECWLASF